MKSRDMQIAEAVRSACANQAGNYPDAEGYIYNLDLTAIIASVGGKPVEPVNKRLLDAACDVVDTGA